MKLDDISKLLANRINQPHYIEHYLKKIRNTAYNLGLKNGKGIDTLPKEFIKMYWSLSDGGIKQLEETLNDWNKSNERHEQAQEEDKKA